jgi:hypothetical protein
LYNHSFYIDNTVLVLLDLSKQHRNIDRRIVAVIHAGVTSPNRLAQHDLPSVTMSARITLRDRIKASNQITEPRRPDTFLQNSESRKKDEWV